MVDAPGAHDVEITERKLAQDKIVGAQLYPQQQVVELRTRGHLAIRDQVTVVSWDVIEGLFLTILQMRLQARGYVVGLQATPNSKSESFPSHSDISL